MRKIQVFFCLFIILFLSSAYNIKNKSIISGSIPKTHVTIKTSDYWIENSIFIEGNATGVDAHNWTWASNQAWCSGSGVWGDPYIIENITISGQPTTCIEIRNSNVYFILKNCTFFDSDGYGILLENVNNSKIIENNITNVNSRSISLVSSNNNSISNNSINSNYYGISLSESCYNLVYNNTSNGSDQSGLGLNKNSNNNTILDNTFNNNLYTGVLIFSFCENNTISGNILKNNGWNGLQQIFRSSNNIIINNYAENNDFSSFYIEGNSSTLIDNVAVNNRIYLDGINHTLKNNSVFNSGFFLHTLYEELGRLDSYQIDTSNKVNGKPFYYFANESQLTPSNFTNAGQVFLINCKNTEISNLNIQNVYQPLTLLYCNDTSVSSSTFEYSYRSVEIKNSINITFNKNNILNSDYGALYIELCHDIYVYDNEVHNNGGTGIKISESSNVDVSENSISNSYEGIDLYQCENCEITHNNVMENTYEGIDLHSSDGNQIKNNEIKENGGSGIDLWNSNDNNIEKNHLKSNKECGISLYLSDDNDIIENDIIDNGYWGIDLDESNHNYVYNNYLRGNGYGCIDDDGTGNVIKDNDCYGVEDDFIWIDFRWIVIIGLLFLIAIVAYINSRQFKPKRKDRKFLKKLLK